MRWSLVFLDFQLSHNQNKVADVCQYLQWLEDFLIQVFQKKVCSIDPSIC